MRSRGRRNALVSGAMQRYHSQMTLTSPPEPAGDDLRALWRAALEWQIELGADEAIGEAPVDCTMLPSKAPPATLGRKRRADPPPAAPKTDPVADARALAAKADSVAALREALNAYNGSPLKKGARNTVFADGNPKAGLMIIGEAPGRDEDRQGLPFVGRSGQLLDRMLAAIGRDRKAESPEEAAYITNVVFYRPLENRTPTDQEVAPLLPFTLRHIALTKPKAILCVGNVPTKHLMGATTGITRFRGTWTEIETERLKIPAIASFHPAYLLRSPDQKRLAWRDLLELEARLAES